MDTTHIVYESSKLTVVTGQSAAQNINTIILTIKLLPITEKSNVICSSSTTTVVPTHNVVLPKRDFVAVTSSVLTDADFNLVVQTTF